MHYTLRNNKPSSSSSLSSSAMSGAARDTTTDSGIKATIDGSKSLSKKFSRTFTVSRQHMVSGPRIGSSSRSTSAKSINSDSDASSSRSSAPSSPRATQQQGFFVRSASPTSSVSSTVRGSSEKMSRQASSDSFLSVYTHGYGSGHYAVNLEEMYSKQEHDYLEETHLAQKGLQKFTVQEYLAIL